MKRTEVDKLTVPFDRSYWVVPGQLLAGCYPGDKDPIHHENKLNALIESGIRHCISLMEPSEYDHSGDPFAPYVDQMEKLASEQKISVTFDNLPIKDLSVPSERFMTRILNQIDLCNKYDKPVYVHCWGGRGRTGTVVGCYLARHGFASGEKALEMIKELRAETPDSNIPSPETSDQIRMVLNWEMGK